MHVNYLAVLIAAILNMVIGAIWYSPRSSREHPGLGVLYPDITKITTLAAYH